MTFAHTTVELPKYGASSRDAEISVAREPAPAQTTTALSTGRDTLAGAATTGPAGRVAGWTSAPGATAVTRGFSPTTILAAA